MLVPGTVPQCLESSTVHSGFPATIEKLERLISRLKDTDDGGGEKIITPPRGKLFFGGI